MPNITINTEELERIRKELQNIRRQACFLGAACFGIQEGVLPEGDSTPDIAMIGDGVLNLGNDLLNLDLALEGTA